VVKGGILGGRVLSADQAKALAKVESRDVLLAQLAGLLNSPIQKMAGLLYAPLGNLGNALYAFRQLRESQETGTAPGDQEISSEAASGDAATEN
jgi:large subunit ribosomal protein L10